MPGQREIEQHQRAVGMAREQPLGFLAVARGEDREARLELRQHLAQRLQDQRMVVDDEDFHQRLPRTVAARGRGSNGL